MSETMIEKATAAITDHTLAVSTETAKTLALAVIEAIREPTDAMINAGNLPGWDDCVTIGLSEEIWRSMIDAALNEHANAR